MSTLGTDSNRLLTARIMTCDVGSLLNDGVATCDIVSLNNGVTSSDVV